MNPSEEFRDFQKKLASGEAQIEFAPQEQVGYLESHIDAILEAVAEVMGNPHIKGAWVSDMSSISDFLFCRNRGRDECADGCVCSFADEEAKLLELLGVPVARKDLLTDVARRLAGLV